MDDQRKTTEALRSLLADRFLLTFHRETREQPSFALTVAKGGPKLQDSTGLENFIRSVGRGLIKGQAVGVGQLALNLSNALDRPVIDKTGPTGKYTFELKWDASPPSAAQAAVASDPDQGSIFTALHEQLGLRLESQKSQVKVLVVDRAEKPSDN
jgi:uncharacterized protein (TIGR03435 family)